MSELSPESNAIDNFLSSMELPTFIETNPNFELNSSTSMKQRGQILKKSQSKINEKSNIKGV